MRPFLGKLELSIRRHWELRSRLTMQWVGLEITLTHCFPPEINELKNFLHIQTMVSFWIMFEITTSHAHKFMCRTQARAGGGPLGVFVHGEMHKSAGQLNESLVKIGISLTAGLQPEILEHIMRFVKIAGIEALEIAKVSRIMGSPRQMRHPFRYPSALVRHAPSIL